MGVLVLRDEISPQILHGKIVLGIEKVELGLSAQLQLHPPEGDQAFGRLVIF